MADDAQDAPEPQGTEEQGSGENGEAEQGPPFMNLGQYTKDLSFEVPGAPGIYGEVQNNQPEINVNVNVNVTPLQDKLYEVVLHTRAECKVGDAIGFVLELAYGGLFSIDVPAEHHDAVLLIECPRMLFPFARNILADVSRDGGFPPLMLNPVDFVAMYQDQVKKAEAEAAPEADA